MTTLEKQKDQQKKILLGLEKAYQKMLEFKRQKNSTLVVIRDGKIVHLKP